ncbi:MAG: hypothetical protein PHQ64_03240 [Bacilli bacterium]|nr:hypothetical protein [Bacilli bacterium]
MNNENEFKSLWDTNSDSNQNNNNNIDSTTANEAIPVVSTTDVKEDVTTSVSSIESVPVVENTPIENNTVESIPLVNPALNIENPTIEENNSVPVEEKTSINETPITNKNSNKTGIILLILFILMMIFVWMLPDIAENVKEYMNRDKEKEYQDNLDKLDDDKKTEDVVEPDSDKDKVLTKTCTMSIVDNNFITNKTIEINYANDLIKNYKMVEVTDYSLDQTVYNEKLSLCNLMSNNFTNKDGYSHICSANNNILTITKVYTLKDFKEAKQTIDNVEYSITSNYKLDDKIDDVISNLTSQGAVCK